MSQPARTMTRSARRAPARSQRRLRVVDTKRAQEARRVRRLVAAFSLMVAVALVAAVAFHVAIAQGQVRLDRAREELAAEQRRYETERFATASAAAPDEIRKRADELGLVEAENPTFLTPPPGLAPVGPERTDSTAPTLAGWPEVKPHLGTSQP